jgi:hypothetical protein
MKQAKVGSDTTPEHAARLAKVSRERQGGIISDASADDPLPHDWLLYPQRKCDRTRDRYVKG